jgi:hypothetical protein
VGFRPVLGRGSTGVLGKTVLNLSISVPPLRAFARRVSRQFVRARASQFFSFEFNAAGGAGLSRSLGSPLAPSAARLFEIRRRPQ